MTTVQTKDHIKLRSTIHQKLIESGEKERLKIMLRNKLVEAGWRDEVKTYCRDYIKNNGGENLTVEELIQHITPIAKKKVSPQVKQDLVKRIRKFLGPNTAAAANAAGGVNTPPLPSH